MTKIIWLTDPHFIAKGTIDGLDPRARLIAALDHANAHYPDAQAAIISGDMIDDDASPDYGPIRDILSTSTMPVLPMMGNNDVRDDFRALLDLPSDLMEDFVQFTLDTPDGHLICLDTHKPGSAAGAFCAKRAAWLDSELHRCKDKPAYIAMHHPPFALGLPPQDAICLEDSETFFDVLAPHDHVAHLFLGHVHRHTSGVLRGVPFATLGALSFQAPPPRPAWEWDTFKAAPEAPHYGVIDLSPQGVVIQYIRFADP